MRGDPAYFSALADWLAGLDGVDDVRTDYRTGGVLVLHPHKPLEALRDRAYEAGWFLLEDLEVAPLPGMDTMERRIRDFDERLGRASQGELDMRALLFLLLMGMAGRQVLQGQVAAPAVTLLRYAMDLLGNNPFRGA